MEIQETRIVIVSLLVLALPLILPAHAGQNTKLEKNVPSNIPEQKSGKSWKASISSAGTDSSLEKPHSSLTAEIEERRESAGSSGNKAPRATGNSKMYVENNDASSNATAIRGEATATGDLENYGGYFKAAGRFFAKGVYGEASTSGHADVPHYGGYFKAAGNYGIGVHGEASETGSVFNYGGHFSAAGDWGNGVYGEATGTGVYTNYGGYFSAAGTKGIGVFGSATNTGSHGNYGGYFKANGIQGCGVYGEASTAGLEHYTPSHGGYFIAPGLAGRGVYGEATHNSGRGVVGNGGQWDFYATSSTNNYGPFTGGHEVRLSDDFPEELTTGMVVSVTGQTQARKVKDRTVSISSTLPTIKLSSAPRDGTVFGVFVSESSLPIDHWYKAKEGERFGTVNALGEGRVWVTNRNGEIQAGDYITTSAIPGYGQRQDDDLLHSYTLGKAIETIDWDQATEMVQYEGEMYKAYLIAVVYTSG